MHCRYEFRDYVLDPMTHELRLAGALVTVPPHAFACLTYLIDHRDRVVGKDELIAAVLGKVDVSDDQLGHIVRKARRAIGERGDEQRAIRTIPRVGFRWVEEVRALTNDPPAQPGQSATLPGRERTELGRFSRSRLAVSILITAAIVAAGAALTVISRRSQDHAPTAAPQEPTRTLANGMAVLPVSGTSDEDLSWIRLGLMDFIGNRLREGSGPVVMASDNVVALLHGPLPSISSASQIRNQLGVRQLVFPFARRTEGNWIVRLDEQGADGTVRTVEAHAADLIEAAKGAADQLLDVHGVAKHISTERLTDASEIEWYQRIEAMILRGESGTARKLLLSADDSHAASARSRLRLGRIELSEGNYSEARAIFEQVLKESPIEVDALIHAETLANLGEANRRLDNLSEASRQFSDSISLLSQLRDSRDLGNAHLGRAITFFVQGQPEKGYADLANARIAFDLAGDTLALARVDSNEGSQAAVEGRTERALQLMAKAADVFERFGALGNLAMVNSNQIGIYLQLERPGAALEIVTRAGDRFDALQNSGLRNAFALRRAGALIENGRIAEGRQQLEAVLRNKDEPDLPLIGIAQGIMAQVEMDTDHPDRASAYADQSVRALTSPDFVSPRSAAWLYRIRALRKLGDKTLPKEISAFQEWAASTRDSGAIVLARLAAAEESWSTGDREGAIAQYQDALDRSARDRPPEEVVDVALSYGGAMIEGGDLQRASAITGRIAPYADSDFRCAILMAKFYRAMQQGDAMKLAVEKAAALAGERQIPESLRTLH